MAHSTRHSSHCEARAALKLLLKLTDLWKLFDPHAGLQLHVLHVQVLGLRGGVVGELHLHGHHVAVGAEGLPAEAVLHRQALPSDAVQQLVALQCTAGRDVLQAEDEGAALLLLLLYHLRRKHPLHGGIAW